MCETVKISMSQGRAKFVLEKSTKQMMVKSIPSSFSDEIIIKDGKFSSSYIGDFISELIYPDRTSVFLNNCLGS